MQPRFCTVFARGVRVITRPCGCQSNCLLPVIFQTPAQGMTKGLREPTFDQKHSVYALSRDVVFTFRCRLVSHSRQ